MDFTVQKHKATTLHYDFRIQIGDILKSWAVPRGPTLNPSLKRLAVETQDHPLSYIHFEGIIPEGSYGAGEVIVWDRGECSYPDPDPGAQYEKGKIKFILAGEKLKGEFILIRTGGPPGPKSKWLLIKKYDEHISYDDITERSPASVISMRDIGGKNKGKLMVGRTDLKKAARGDGAAMEKIYSTYSSFVFNVALKTSLNPSVASDVTQEVFIKIFKNLKKFKFKSSLRTWIYRITVNTALNMLEKEKRREGVQLDTSFYKSDEENSLRQQQTVEELLSVLGEKERLLIVLRELEGLSYREISSAAEMKLGTVKTKIYRAREKMREAWKEKFS